MKRIEAYIEKLIKEKSYRKIGCICCEDIPCNECPNNTSRDAYGCHSIEKLGKWLMEDMQTETYTERIITGCIYYTANGKSCNSCDNLTEDALVQYTYIIRTEEDERNAKEKEQGLRLCGYKVKVQNFIHEKTEVFPWDKEQE